MKYIFLDTETTGTEAEDRICQLAYLVDNTMSYGLVKPPLKIKVAAMATHHITNKMVEDKKTFKEVFEADLTKQLKENIVVAHNAKFDVAMLAKEGISPDRVICTLKIAKHLDEKGVIESYALQYLRYLLGLEIDEATPAHDAKADVLVLEKLFQRLLTQMHKKTGKIETEEVLNEMIRISKEPSLVRKFNFGKHKGKTVEEVAKTSKDYLEWLYNEKKKEPEVDEDWIYTLKKHLNI